MARQVALAVDLGASGGRVVSGSFDGTCLELEELYRFENAPVLLAGELVWYIVRLCQEVVSGLRIAAGRHGNNISSIGVDTWGVDFALLASDDSLLANPVSYRDSRTHGTLCAVEKIVSRKDIFNFTGVQFMEINTLYQLFAMQQKRSSVLQSADRLLLIPDLMHWLLTGRRSNERTNASTTQCLDPLKGTWAMEMLERLGIPLRIFGELFDPGTELGPIRDDVQAETGLGPVRIILPGTHDTASAVAAVPADAPPSSRPDWCYVSLGTWALLGAELDRPRVTPECMAANFTNEIGIGGTTRLLKNICGLWLVHQCRASWLREGATWTWDQLTALAREAKPLESLIDPNHHSLLSPSDMPAAIRSLAGNTGEPVPSTTAAVVRCALESVAAACRRTIDELDSLIGRRTSRIHIVGGGVKNAMLCQMIADACNRSVIAGPVEATAIGNLLVQLTSTQGSVDLRSIRSIVRNSFELSYFEPKNAPLWDARAARTAWMRSTESSSA